MMRALLVLLAGCSLALAVVAADGDPQPIPPFGARVTDLTGTLTPQQVQTLSGELEALEKRKGSRVAVLMLPTTAPEDIAAYGIRVTDAWKLSRTGGQTHDGVLLIVAKDDHRVRIEVGQDLEGAIPDAAAARIIREYVTPKFRAGDYAGGIEDALAAITKLIDGEALPPPLADEPQGRSHGDIGNALLFAFFIGLWARGMFGRLSAAPRAGLVGAVTGGAGWLLSGLLPLGVGLGVVGLVLGALGGGGGGFANRGGWGGWGGGGFGGGGFGGGGGGGGGFSGGSSGGFSGGGASGSW